MAEVVNVYRRIEPMVFPGLFYGEDSSDRLCYFSSHNFPSIAVSSVILQAEDRYTPYLRGRKIMSQFEHVATMAIDVNGLVYKVEDI